MGVPTDEVTERKSESDKNPCAARCEVNSHGRGEGFRVSVFGFRVSGFGFGFQGSGFGVQGLELRIWGSGFGV